MGPIMSLYILQEQIIRQISCLIQGTFLGFLPIQKIILEGVQLRCQIMNQKLKRLRPINHP